VLFFKTVHFNVHYIYLLEQDFLMYFWFGRILCWYWGLTTTFTCILEWSITPPFHGIKILIWTKNLLESKHYYVSRAAWLKNWKNFT